VTTHESVIFCGHMRLSLPRMIALLALVGNLACSRRPTREIADARARLAEAERSGAPLFAPGSYEEAKRALGESEHLSKLGRYEDARIIALESAARSRSAVGMAGENRKKMLDALTLTLQTTEHDLGDAAQEIRMAETSQVEPERIEIFRRDLAAARLKLEQARRLDRAGDLAGGRRASEDARIAADVVLREVRFSIADHPISHPAPKKPRRAHPRP